MRNFLRTSFSSKVAGDVLSRLIRDVSTTPCNPHDDNNGEGATASTVCLGCRRDLPVQFLRLLCYQQFLAFLFYLFVSCVIVAMLTISPVSD